MRARCKKCGFTLIEMLIVIAIIVLLVGMVAGIAKRLDDQSKERLCRNELALIDTALEQFHDFGYLYKHIDFDGLTFPLDCNDMDADNIDGLRSLQATLNKAIYPTTAPLTTVIISERNAPQYDTDFSGSEALYFILNQVPECRTTLSKIDKSLLTNRSADNTTDVNVTIATPTITTTLPLTRFIDPWKKSLRYDYYPDFNDYTILNPLGSWADYINNYRNPAKLTFPIVTSAGPDGKFDTADDIVNRKP
jgi:prepilin-type N-terminal cleavage/methylation domain-containing protein